LGDYLCKGGLLITALSLLLLFLIFFPAIKNELKYLFSSKNKPVKIVLEDEEVKPDEESEVIVPADKNFSLIIPKIGANEKVVAQVNPFEKADYQKALRQGVAHAKGSSLPGEKGNVFFFAHSSDNFYAQSQTNTVFFLLNKLERGDVFNVVFQKKIYAYEVSEKKIVASEQVEYLENKKDKETIALMTCWPPGTDFKRLLVLGERKPSEE